MRGGMRRGVEKLYLTATSPYSPPQPRRGRIGKYCISYFKVI